MDKELAIECIKTQKQFVDDMTKEAFDMAIGELSRPSDGDLISRQDAIKTVRNSEVLLSYDSEWSYDVLAESAIEQTRDCLTHALNTLPSAEAETKCIAQITVDAEEVVRRIKEEYDIVDGWIPCSERLPNGQTEVIVSCIDDSGDTKYSYTSSGWITTDKEYWIVDNEINPFVIAWMQLPEPYEPQGSEGKG